MQFAIVWRNWWTDFWLVKACFTEKWHATEWAKGKSKISNEIRVIEFTETGEWKEVRNAL